MRFALKQWDGVAMHDQEYDRLFYFVGGVPQT